MISRPLLQCAPQPFLIFLCSYSMLPIFLVFLPLLLLQYSLLYRQFTFNLAQLRNSTTIKGNGHVIAKKFSPGSRTNENYLPYCHSGAGEVSHHRCVELWGRNLKNNKQETGSIIYYLSLENWNLSLLTGIYLLYYYKEYHRYIACVVILQSSVKDHYCCITQSRIFSPGVLLFSMCIFSALSY